MYRNILRKTIIFLLLFFVSILYPISAHAYTTNMSASVVIGQATFTTSTTGTSSTAFNAPRGIKVCDGKIVLADLNNSRVLIWNSIPTSDNQAADVVIGQPDFASNTANNGGRSAATLNKPFGVGCANGKLFIADNDNHRVLIYNSIPTTNGASADVVVGQSDFSSGSANQGGVSPDANTLQTPHNVTSDGAKLYIADTNNRRILIYNSIPTVNNASANVVIGQADFTTRNFACTQSGLGNQAIGIFVGKGKLVIGDTFGDVNTHGNRVLIYNSIPTVNNAPADVVVGQANFTTCVGNTGASGLNDPFEVFIDNKDRLIIADRSNRRLLIYKTVPSSNGASADLVIGQSNFTNNSINQGQSSPGANTLSGARTLTIYNNQLFVSDGDNNRILIFNDDPPPPGPVIGAFNPNCLPFFKYCTQAGMNYQGTIQAITGGVDAPQVKVLLTENATIHDVYIPIEKVDPSDLVTANIPFPWMQGYNTVSDIYNFQLLSAFNGYPLPSFENPVTIVMTYDPLRLGGVSPNLLRIGYYDPTANRWRVLQNNTVINPLTYEIANTTKTLGYFSVVYSRP